MNVHAVANLVAFAAILLLCIVAWSAMSWRTRHCYRVVYGVMGVSSLCLVLAPLYGQRYAEWVTVAQLALNVAFAVYMALDRRRVRHHRDA